MTEKVLFAWSGGKDSALGLYELGRSGDYEVATLLTTVTADYDRVSMHGVRVSLLEDQARALGYPLDQVRIRAGGSSDDYSAAMRERMEFYRGRGVRRVAFADLFLADLRRWREERLAEAGMEGLFPLWGVPTAELARRFLRLGFKTVITCVDGNALDAGFAGREYDAELLDDLPAAVDPCGENGEFHSFCYDGPIFRRPVRFRRGETVRREDRFHFCDLILEEQP